jgi:hypothetical protein
MGIVKNVVGVWEAADDALIEAVGVRRGISDESL